MNPRRAIVGFFVRLAVYYAALMTAWPVVKTGYGAYYRALGETCFGRFGTQAIARFEAWPQEDDVKDTIVRLENHSVPDVRIEKRMPISSRYTGYMPTAVVLSLLLATPLPWRRRGPALVVGLALVHVLILGWLWLSILDDLSDPLSQVPSHGWLLPGPLKAVVKFLVVNVGESVVACAYVFPVFIWLASAFRRTDRALILARIGLIPQPSDDASAPRPEDSSHTA
jgi:hypothetical protein